MMVDNVYTPSLPPSILHYIYTTLHIYKTQQASRILSSPMIITTKNPAVAIAIVIIVIHAPLQLVMILCDQRYIKYLTTFYRKRNHLQ